MKGVLLLWLVILSGCSSTKAPPPLPVLPVPIAADLRINDGWSGGQQNAESTLPLNVSIQVFRGQSDVTGSLYSSAAQVRSVERRLIPLQLKQVLDRSGYWGAVRLLPRPDPNAEVNITGQVLSSDGVVLRLAVRVVDARGVVWFDSVYEDTAQQADYDADPNPLEDPFDDLYEQIANDMSAYHQTINSAAMADIVDVAFLKYAGELSPQAFDRYLLNAEGVWSVVGLPARDDPIFNRLQRIRESEYVFADSVDDHYNTLGRQLGRTYAWWRHYSYELIIGNRRLETVDAKRGATQGSWYAMERIYRTYKESKMNEDALRELTESFDRETAPTAAEVAGRVVQLTGTLDEQYEQWRNLLSQAWEAETGP